MSAGTGRRAAPESRPDPAPDRLYVVDRIAGDVAVLVPDDDTFPDEDVSIAALPSRPSEGDVLRVPVRDGAPVWQAATADPRSRAERLSAADRRLERLAKRDPGGDVAL